MSDEIVIPRKRSLLDPEPTDTLYIKGAPELIEFAERECARCGYPTRRQSPSAMLLRIFEEKLRASRQASPQSDATSSRA